MPADPAPSNRASQTAITRQDLLRRVVKLVRRANLDYAGWRYLAKQVRQACDLRPAKKGRKLPRILPEADFRRFYAVVDRADDVQHAVLLRFLFFTGIRVSELCHATVADLDLEACKLRVEQGKGGKDRYVLFPTRVALVLRTHLAAHPGNRYLFQTRRHTKFSARRVQEIVQHYAGLAGVTCTPHTFRHQALSWLTVHSGLSEAELRLLSGHDSPRSLAIYQHVGLSGQVKDGYARAMKDVDL